MFLCIRNYEEFRNKVLKVCMPGWAGYETEAALDLAIKSWNRNESKFGCSFTYTHSFSIALPEQYPCMVEITSHEGTYGVISSYYFLYERELTEFQLFFEEIKRHV